MNHLSTFHFYSPVNEVRNTYLLDFIKDESRYNRWENVELVCTAESLVYRNGVFLRCRVYEMWGDEVAKWDDFTD